ncbi:helix-loop-helix DNA-binding domain-containing transcription factor [Gigaspora margarita]|uniref:Helix-loop-helix DNA-binding domain-containing transcription factor n=1 Tax=Gigaspora margarita TaxID=4874 RepID=A0A8H4EQ43_GIGMA|nr:helix-loop-helix DNA-binding domain-containing transcription factor [Gigaspora margarita]
MCESNSLNTGSTEFQDLLTCESPIDDILASINKLSPSQTSSINLIDYENQIQEMFFNNNTLSSSPPQSGDLSLNEFQYPVPSSDMLSLGSPESFIDLSDPTSLDNNIYPESLQYSLISNQNSTEDIFSQKPFLYTQKNSTNIDDINPSEPLYYSPIPSESSNDEIHSPDTLSPLTYNIFKDLNVSPINFALADIGNNSSMNDIFNTPDTLLLSESNLDPTSPVIPSENSKKRTSIRYDSSSDESSKKKRKATNGTVKNYKSTKKDKSQTSNEGSNKRLNVSEIDVDTIKTILASLLNIKNQKVDAKSVQENHSDDDEDMACDENENGNMSYDEGTSSDTKPCSKSSTSPSQKSPNSKTIANKQKKKVAHNVIERRYRNNINDRINDLKNVVPALCHLKSKDDDVIEEVDGIPAATKTNKATILKKATEYIVHLKENNQKVKTENDVLRKIIESIPGGAELYDSYLTNDNELTPPRTPPSENDRSFRNEFSSSRIGGSRILMSLFMCMTFLTDPSKYAQSGSHHHHHHDEGRVVVGNDSIESAVQNKIYNSQDNMTIDIWYFARVFTFLICFTYVIWPSLFSIKSQRTRKSTIISCLNSKAKDSKELYLSLSSLSNTSSMNTLGYVVGLFLESLRLFMRKVLGCEISCGCADVDMDERLLEVELWNRLGEAELCGGNKHATRFSVLYTCFKTINLLENPYIYHRNMRTSPRIYANASLQCHVGLRSIPILSHKAVSYFWNLAIKEKGSSNLEEKWLEIALINDKDNKILESVANRINVFHLSKKEETPKSIINTTIPLIYVSEIRALFHIKEAFSNLISVRHNVNKVQKKSKFTFSELLSITTPTFSAHWYALVGCIVQAFYEGNNDLGVKLMNKLNEESKTNDDLSKQMIILGLLSRSLLICGQVEASIHCADKVTNYPLLRKNQETRNVVEIDEDLVIRKIVNDIEKLAEFCVGWIVLETRIVVFGIVGNLISKNKDKALSNVLDDKHLKTSIDIWARYLRRSSKFDVFDRIPKLREKLIKKLDIVGRIVSDLDEEIDSRDDYDKQNNNEYKATRALRVLKGMQT